ncbi:MAG: proline dehydrogenase family protein, partial [Gammaproteobacteria bacterium]|nr:proline dehydrogenase family protein [Gammaproteobacteria bacterium]
MATATDALMQSDRAMIFAGTPPKLDTLRAAMNEWYLLDETACVDALLPTARLDDAARQRVTDMARRLVEAVRKNQAKKGGIDAFMNQYDLSSQEGVVLMCLAEALLRIPDSDTADKLIEDKLSDGNWEEHLGESSSLFVNFSTWGLMLTGKIVNLDRDTLGNVGGFMKKLVKKSGEPMIRTALKQAMRIMGHQFVMGRNIKEALKRAVSKEHRDYRHSYDMLGEAALTAEDAQRYFDAYAEAIDAIGASKKPEDDVFSAPNISVKLSALHPRYEFAQRDRVINELVPRVLALAERAKKWNMGLPIDAEEAERL